MFLFKCPRWSRMVRYLGPGSLIWVIPVKCDFNYDTRRAHHCGCPDRWIAAGIEVGTCGSDSSNPRRFLRHRYDYLLQFGGVRDYQSFDKAVDLVYMVTFLVVALKWSGTPRTMAIALFGYRILGVAAFELSSSRAVLLLFPNVFEFWFVFVAGLKRFRPGYEMTWRRAAVWMAPLLLLKELQEDVLHWNQVLDNYGTVDLVVSWWGWIVALF